MASAPKRMEKLGHDPVRPVLEVIPDLPTVLERLMGKFDGEVGAPRKPGRKRKG
jgi:hypothetical protein